MRRKRTFDQEHERVLMWRVLSTDAAVLLMRFAAEVDPSSPILDMAEGWQRARERQLKKDRDEGCMR